ncbi:hypothetical protein HOLleu_43854 [Holothuria leucospilota]|uniref:HTH CENPB-type domain-containing protein n=1 Tax=Holothuria leucospilota TaxID=206669 RepID=A0A9Q0YDA0_HOLLE|nr:hypothetical protein HOLleu_43854 [Holothuria leucospilota]
MRKALQNVENGSPTTTAARENGVPRKTLSDRVHKKLAVDAKLGAECKLSKDSEETLNQYIQYIALRAFPLTVNQISMFAWTIDKASGSNKFGENGPSYHWWRRFKARHPDLRLRRPDPLDRSRAVNSTANNPREYFSLLKEVLPKYHLDDKPDRIFNCDESIIVLNKSAQSSMPTRGNKRKSSKKSKGRRRATQGKRKKAEKEKQEAQKRKRKEEAEARKKAKNEKTKSMKQLNVTETVPVQEEMMIKKMSFVLFVARISLMIHLRSSSSGWVVVDRDAIDGGAVLNASRRILIMQMTFFVKDVLQVWFKNL